MAESPTHPAELSALLDLKRPALYAIIYLLRTCKFKERLRYMKLGIGTPEPVSYLHEAP